MASKVLDGERGKVALLSFGTTLFAVCSEALSSSRGHQLVVPGWQRLVGPEGHEDEIKFTTVL